MKAKIAFGGKEKTVSGLDSRKVRLTDPGKPFRTDLGITRGRVRLEDFL